MNRAPGSVHGSLYHSKFTRLPNRRGTDQPPLLNLL
jgi:hypothetical protein